MAIQSITLKDPDGKDQVSIILEQINPIPAQQLKDILNDVVKRVGLEREPGDTVVMIIEEEV